MTTPEAEPLPPFAEPYRPDFAAIERMLARVQGFSLQPIEAPSPDLAHAFAAWLGLRGWTAETIDLKHEQLDGLAHILTQRGAAARRVILVAAPNDLDEANAQRSLAAVNWARDRIASELACPVLWWGNKAFHRMTWAQAPDLWSVAGPPYRIPLRRLVDEPAQLLHSLYGWTGAVAQVEAAVPRLASADHSPGRLNPLDVAAPLIDDEPVTSGERLRRRLEQLHSQSGTERAEALLRVRLAQILESTDNVAAVQEYARARRTLAELGDVSVTLWIDFHLIFDLWPGLDESLIDALVQHASTVEQRSGHPEDLARALLIQAKVAIVRQDLTRAEELGRAAVPHAKAAQTIRPKTLQKPALVLATTQIFAFIALARGDLAECLACTREWIEEAKITGDSLLLFHGLSMRAAVLERLERPADAAHALRMAAKVAETLYIPGRNRPDQH